MPPFGTGCCRQSWDSLGAQHRLVRARSTANPRREGGLRRSDDDPCLPPKDRWSPRYATLTPLRFTGRLYVHSDPNAAQGAHTDGLLEGEHCSCQFMSWKVWKRAPPLLLCSAGTSSGVQAFSSVIWVPLGGEETDLDATAMAAVTSSLSSVSVAYIECGSAFVPCAILHLDGETNRRDYRAKVRPLGTKQIGFAVLTVMRRRLSGSDGPGAELDDGDEDGMGVVRCVCVCVLLRD